MPVKKVVSKTRRGNNEGSIYQRKNGSWSGMATIGYDENGKPKRKTVYGNSKIEVAQKLNEITNRICSGNYSDTSNAVLSEIMGEWLMVYKQSQISPRSFENCIRIYNKYIVPNIGGMKLNEIAPITVQKLLKDMQDKNLSLAYIKKCKHLLRQFFEYAVDNNLLIHNPIDKTKVKSRERKLNPDDSEYKALPKETRNKLISSLSNHKFLQPFCFAMMFAGLRTGEALGLKWKDIDFAAGEINVERAITVVPKFDENGKVVSRQTVIGATKTACSVRTVPMPKILIDTLTEYKQKQENKSVRLNYNLTDNNTFVFCNDDGTFRTYSGTKTIFYRFLDKYQLDDLGIHFHMLRHTFANTLFEAHKNPKVIQQLLGHKAVSTTITTYNSVDKDDLEEAVGVFNSMFTEDMEQTSYLEKQTDAQDEKVTEALKSLNENDLQYLLKQLMKLKTAQGITV